MNQQVIDQFGILDPALMAEQINAALAVAAVDVSSAELLACHTTPVIIVPAPGTGKMIVVNSILIKYKNEGTHYAGGASAARLYYDTVVILSGQSWLNQNTDFVLAGPPTVVTGALSGFENKAVKLFSTSNPTTGNGTAIIFVWYKVVDIS